MITEAAVAGYKAALLRHPIDLQLILACTSILLGIGVHQKGLPVYIVSYIRVVPAWVITLTFLFSGLLSLASLSERLIGATANIVNNVVIMFLWVWLAIGTISNPSSDGFSYLMASPPLACLWVLAHSLLPKQHER